MKNKFRFFYSSNKSSRQFAWQQIICVPLLLTLFACSPYQEYDMKLLPSEEFQKEVERFITVGMPIQQAKQIVESNGFICESYQDTEFAVEERDNDGRLIKETYIRGDYFSCIVERSYVITYSTWGIVIQYKSNKVILIDTSVRSLSP
jgi:hypothetical protein